MFFRIKLSGERRYLQIVENTRDGARTVQRVVATLVTNAREAMNDRGVLTVGAVNVCLDQPVGSVSIRHKLEGFAAAEGLQL